MTTKTKVLRTIWGISVGDCIHTSYGTGGVIDQIVAPHYTDRFVGTLIIRTWPVITVIYDKTCIVNDIRREGDQFFTDAGDKMTFDHKLARKPGKRQQFQWAMDLEGDGDFEPPYPFVPSLDYSGNIWKCPTCGDFNAEPEQLIGGAPHRWYCTTCGKYGVKKIVVMPPRVLGEHQTNSYLLYLNY